MAPPARWRGAGLVALFALLAAAALPTASAADPGSPVAKVVELLKVLSKQLENDGRSDTAQYKKYDKWFKESDAESKKVISQTSSKIDELASSLEEQDAFRTKASQSFEKVSNALAKLEGEYNEAKARRAAERKTFEKNEADFMKGVDTLERSIAVLEKKMPKSAALLAESQSSQAMDDQDSESAAPKQQSLVSVAKKLRSLFESSKDFSLSTAQQDSVDSFVRLAAEGAVLTPEASTLAAASFLQVEAQDNAEQAAPDSGGYESQSGGILATLSSVLGKTKKQLSDNQKQEAIDAKEYKKLVSEMEKETKNKEKAISELRAQIAQSQEKTGQMKAQLVAAKELLKVTNEQMQTVQEEYAVKTREYKDRVGRRSDEELAVKEAMEILNSKDMKKILAKKAASYVQYEVMPRREVSEADVAPARRAPAVEGGDEHSLSFLQSRSHSRLHTRADPFGKVKSLIRNMLRKLTDQQSKDAKHAAWCDSEMAKSTQSKEFKENFVQKLKDRIEQMDAEIGQLTNDLKEIADDLADIKKNTAEATKVRMSEARKAKKSLAQYKDAQKLVASAIKVLQRVYAKDSKVSSKAEDRGDMGSGVVGLLEVVVDNYAKLEQELSVSEGVAQKDYKKLMDESEIRQAVFNKDLEGKNRQKTKLNGDRMRASADLKSYEKELSAVLSYLAELKSACVKKDSYEDRKARREKELGGLKEALDFLNRG